MPVTVSFSENQMSWELGTELNFVLRGLFSQMKNKRLPSADTVGRNSGYIVFTVFPKFSIFRMVPAVMIFSFCGISLAPDASVKKAEVSVTAG